MRKQSALFSPLLILAFVSIGQLSFAQSPATLTGSIGAGLLSPISSNLKGNIFSTYDYPLSKTGYDIRGKIRLDLSALPFTIVGMVSYNSLTDNADIPVTTPAGVVVTSDFHSSLSIFDAGVGFEYPLLPTPIFKPYIGASAVMNFISGSASYETGILREAKLNSTSRLGLDLGFGTLIDIPKLPFSLDLQATYRLANLSGKSFGSSNGIAGFGGIPQTASYDLNDAKNPADPIDHSRSISYVTIALSLNFILL